MEIPYIVHPRPDTGVYNAKVGMWLFLASEVMLFGGLFSAYVLLRVGAPPELWPHGWLNITLGTINTILLASSAITTLLAWAALKLKNFPRYKLCHALTLVLAVTFLGIKSYEYRDKFHHYQINLTDGRVADGHMIENDARKDYLVIEGRIVADASELYDLRAAKEPPRHEELKLARKEIQSMQNYGPWHNNFLAIYFTLTGLHALHILGGALVIAWLWGPGSKMWATDPERFTNRVEVSGLFWHFVDLVWIFLFPVLYLT
jgi:cytochrome c oxidase subunit 3